MELKELFGSQITNLEHFSVTIYKMLEQRNQNVYKADKPQRGINMLGVGWRTMLGEGSGKELEEDS